MSISFKSLIQIESGFKISISSFLEIFMMDLKRSIGDTLFDPSGLDFETSQVITVSPNLEIVISNLTDNGSPKSLRIRATELKNQTERWVTQYSIHESFSSKNESHLVVEINSPPLKYSRHPKWPQVPRLLNEFIRTKNLGDLGYSISTPRLIDGNLAAVDFIDYLRNPKRRASALVGIVPGMENIDEYQGMIIELMSQTGGTATSFIFNSESMGVFNSLVPEVYSISAEYIRIFNPQLNFDEIYQAHRHKKVFLSSIDELGLSVVSKKIAAATRDVTIKRSFPLSLQKRETILSEQEQKVLAQGIRISFVKDDSPSQPVQQLQVLHFAEGSDKRERDFALAMLYKFFGSDSINPQDLIELITNPERISSLKTEIDILMEERDELILDGMQLREDLDEEALGRLELFEQRNKLEAEIRYLRESLVNTKNAELAYVEMPQGEYDPLPLTFSEVLNRLDQLVFVTFTGDASMTLALDNTDTGSSAPHCWDYLQVLEDYGRAKVMEIFDSNLMQYLKHTPTGLKTMSHHKYAPVESEQTTNRRSLLEARTFPVPIEVDPSGKALMEAHLKLSRRIRMHFLDDTRGSGRIYVGFIGNHLPLVS